MLCEASVYTVYNNMQPLANNIIMYIYYVSVQKCLYCTPTEPDSESMNTCAVVIEVDSIQLHEMCMGFTSILQTLNFIFLAVVFSRPKRKKAP